MAGLGQYGADQLTWSSPYNLQGRKPTVELSPGSRKNMGSLGIQKPKKGFYGDEDELETTVNPDLYLNQLFGKDVLTTSSLYSQSSGGSLGVLGDDGLSGLGLHQPQRGFGSQQHLSRGFSSSSITGHITPTSTGMHSFPSSLSSGLPQQPSPSRNMLSMSSRGSLGGQVNRDMKRPIPGTIGMPGFGIMQHNRGFSHNMLSGGLQSMSGSFSSTSGNEAPSTLDLSEFPSLTNRGRQENSGGVPMNSMIGRTAYVGMVKQPASESTEFQIHSEDFPALPGSQVQETTTNDTNMKVSGTAIDTKDTGRFPGDKNSSQVQKRGIQTSPDGKVTNIPGGMVMDQFGLVGLLTFIRAAETDPNLVALALGSDLTTLGLNLNSAESLHPNFGGPYAESPCRPQDIDFHVPIEYLTNMTIREKLAPVKLNRYTEDLLFYMFYTNGGDVLQLAAAAELYNREWRFHKEERVWVTRAYGMAPTEKTNSYERGMYHYFDAEKWRKVAKEFHLDYDKLEERPHLPPTLQPPLPVS